MSNIRRVDGAPVPQVSAPAGEPADVKSTDSPAEGEKHSSQPSQDGSAKILEGKIQGMLKESLLRADADKAQGNQSARMNRKQEIGTNIEKINSKIQSALETKEKVAAHLSGMQQEIQELRSQIKELREQMKQIEKTPGDARDLNSPKGQLAKELKMKERALESKLNHLIDQTQGVLRDAVKELTGVNPSLDTSAQGKGSLEKKLKDLEGLSRQLSDLLNGTSNAGKVVVKIGGSEVTAQGLRDYISKLQGLEKQLRSEQRKLEE